jgi:ubiquinone/menaquinone biosynthesis C-methylase UbiE
VPLYNFLAPAYGFAFESIFRPFRVRALEVLPDLTGATVLDLACGTGQNFPLLVERIGSQGKIIGVDISSGMLKNARQRVERNNLSNVALIHLDAARLKEKS